MAGIGFQLEKLLKKDSITGFVYASVISAGPIFFTILFVGILGFISFSQLLLKQYLLFRSTLVYIYAFSLIISGAFQMIINRYVSDRLYLQDRLRIVPVFVATIIISSFVCGILGILFFSLVGESFRYAIISSMLFIVITNIWITMTFISPTKNYNVIVNGFLIGNIVGLGAGYFFGTKNGMIGYLNGFLIGQALTFSILSGAIFREFPFHTTVDFGFLVYFKLIPELVFIGLFFNLAIWVDKFIFWFSTDSVKIAPFMYTFSEYERAVFLAYLSILPTLALFIIKVETSFYLKYKDFYKKIVLKKSLENIKQAHNEIMENLQESIALILKIQGVITFILILFYKPLCTLLKMNGIEQGIFRISLLGAFLLVLLQMLVLIMLYFEFRKEALYVVTTFLLLNIIFTTATLFIGTSSFGYGILGSSFFSLLLGYCLFTHQLEQLEYNTFMLQPMRNVRG